MSFFLEDEIITRFFSPVSFVNLELKTESTSFDSKPYIEVE